MYNYKADKKKLKAIVKKNECRIRRKIKVKIVPPQKKGKKSERKREKKKKMGRKKHRARSSSLR